MKLKCDGDTGCGKSFNYTPHVEKVRKDIWAHGFVCPYCGKEYIGFYSNSRIQSEQETMRSLRTKYDSAIVNKNYTRAVRLKKYISMLEKRTKVDLNKLKARMQS